MFWCFKCHLKRTVERGRLCPVCMHNLLVRKGREENGKTCLICGVKFKTNRNDRVYCSQKCKNKTVNMVSFMRNMRKRFLDPFYQVKQLSLVRIYWKKARQPVLVYEAL